MGFDGLFFGRADYQDHQHRYDTKTMEMVWKGSANLGSSINERITFLTIIYYWNDFF
jgi:hypothetical protein